MKKIKKIISIILTAFLLCGLSISSIGALTESAVKGGISFNSDGYWSVEKPLKLSSHSFTAQAWVCFPKSQSKKSRGGVIIGNYGSNSQSISVEVFTNGAPRVFFMNSDGTVYDFKFTSVNLYNSSWNHLAVTSDGSSLKCYINGKLKETKALSAQSKISVESCFAVGGDYRANNSQYFKGNIKSVAIWSKARSKSDISADMKAVSGQNLLASYNFENIGKSTKSIKNSVKGGATLKYVPVWFTDKEAVTDYDYSFAAIGDTQTVCYYTPDDFGKIYDFIIDNAYKKKIKFVFGLGDITEKSTDPEWDLTTKNIRRMNGIVPYSLVRGNHDYISSFNKYCVPNQYGFTVEGTFDSTGLNTYRTLKVGNINYLLVTLDYGPSDEVLEWANKIISQYPKHNVIITTHAFLFRDGSTLDISDAAKGGWVPTNDGGHNNGDDLWDKLVSKHKNIVLVMCGHEPCDDIKVTFTKGIYGNTVTQMLIDPQDTDRILGCSGLVAMLYFSNGGRHVTVEYYSVIRNKYFLTTNQFDMDIAVVGVTGKAGLTNSDKKTDTKKDNSENGNTSEKNNNSGNKNSSANGNTSESFDNSITDYDDGNTADIRNNSNTDYQDIDSDATENEIGTGDGNNNITPAGTQENKKTESENSDKSQKNTVALILSIVFILLVCAATVLMAIKIFKKKG